MSQCSCSIQCACERIIITDDTDSVSTVCRYWIRTHLETQKVPEDLLRVILRFYGSIQRVKASVEISDREPHDYEVKILILGDTGSLLLTASFCMSLIINHMKHSLSGQVSGKVVCCRDYSMIRIRNPSFPP